jgi:hypothetical protein
MVLDSLQPTCGIATSRQEISAWTAKILTQKHILKMDVV